MGPNNWIVAWTSYVVVGTGGRRQPLDGPFLRRRRDVDGSRPLNNDAATDPYFDFPPEIVTDRAGTWVVV
jgi:hypothetical protein